jgi:hypothetical protein
MMREGVTMKHKDMCCLSCFYGTINKDKNDDSIYVICNADPMPYTIGGLLEGSLDLDPAEYDCGQGIWFDKDSGRWVSTMAAEDAMECFLERKEVP